jgi:hypothetical protein
MQVYWANKAYWPTTAFDGGRFRCFLADGWRGDPVGGSDEAAAVDESSVDRVCLGVAERQGEVGAGFAVVGEKVSTAKLVAMKNPLMQIESHRGHSVSAEHGFPVPGRHAGPDGEG